MISHRKLKKFYVRATSGERNIGSHIDDTSSTGTAAVHYIDNTSSIGTAAIHYNDDTSSIGTQRVNTKSVPDFVFGPLQLISLSIFPLMAIGLVMFVGSFIWHFLLLLYEAYQGKYNSKRDTCLWNTN